MTQQLPAPVHGFKDIHSFTEAGGQGGNPSSRLTSYMPFALPAK